MTLETQARDIFPELPGKLYSGFCGVQVMTQRALLAGHRFMYKTVIEQLLVTILCPCRHRKGQAKEGNGRNDEYLSP
jgi:hypothetical protein